MGGGAEQEGEGFGGADSADAEEAVEAEEATEAGEEEEAEEWKRIDDLIFSRMLKGKRQREERETSLR